MSAGPVVSNPSPLIALHQIGRLELLRDLFGEVLIPEAVARETAGDVPPQFWLPVRAAPHPLPSDVVVARLGGGEREAVALARVMGASSLILDDLPARRMAVSLGLPVVGTLGVLLAAKQAGLLAAIAPDVDSLVRHNFRFSPALRDQILRAAGEQP